MRARMLWVVLPLLAAACDGSSPDERPPVLEFPEAGVDDPAAYEGYRTRFFRDVRGNTVQIYLDSRSGRAVHVWADAENESAAFTVRDAEGEPVALGWGGPGAIAGESAATGGEPLSALPRRALRYRLSLPVSRARLGAFVLGTMRKERDVQYAGWHLEPFGDPFVLPELAALVASLERLPADIRARHLERLGADDVEAVRARLAPRLTLETAGGGWRLRAEQTSLDGRNHVAIEIADESGGSTATLEGTVATLDGDAAGGIDLDVSVSTDGEALVPLGRERIFNDAFETWFAGRRAVADSLRTTLAPADAAGDPRVLGFRRIERQALALELLSYEEKLMASLPNYATYFGRDQMMSALMLEPVASVDLEERVIASVLGKVAADGNVSHEEALGGQAIRENAAEYVTEIDAWATAPASPAAEAHLARAEALLEDLQAVRENYRMVDDDFQLAVLAARWIRRDDVSVDRKRAFLTAAARARDPASPTRLEALLRNFGFALELARPYAERPVPTNLVSFFHRDARGWLPGSWRDSRAGYGGGRFGMDVNVIWVPRALASIRDVLDALDGLGLPAVDAAPEGAVGARLATLLRDPGRLDEILETWRGARRHFVVSLPPERIRRGVAAWIAARPAAERDDWRSRVERADATGRPLVFLALALDDAGRPIPAPNTDPATELFLADGGDISPDDGPLSDPADLLDPFERPFPVGLFLDGVGPLVVNDVYAPRAVREAFAGDPYHGPTVVWGREVNLLMLGLARQIERRGPTGAAPSEARRVLEATRAAVDASGLAHNELWTYRIEDGAPRAVRYGVSSDIQLWNVTDLAVTYLLDRLNPQPDP